jgi:hypothetical protein
MRYALLLQCAISAAYESHARDAIKPAGLLHDAVEKPCDGQRGSLIIGNDQ